MEVHLKRITLIAFSSFFFSSIALADIVFKWGTTSPSEAFTSVKDRFVVAQVAHSRSGGQHIYFRIEIEKGASPVCDKLVEDYPEKRVAKFDGKAVQMFYWCKKYTDSSRFFVELTPATPRGEAFVLNKFLKSTEVRFGYGKIDTKLSAVGFTKAWKSGGGDAL